MMSTFLDEVERCFGSPDLYAALGVGKEAKDSELKRAYQCKCTPTEWRQERWKRPQKSSRYSTFHKLRWER